QARRAEGAQEALARGARSRVAIPPARLCVVHPVASGVTKTTLVSFRRFMRAPGYVRPFALVFAVLASAAYLFALSPTVRAACGGSASATPCPTPVNAFLSLDVTQGGPNTVINVSGGQFNPNQTMTLYWDTPNHVAGSATADASG